jgi:hypothetical protein
MPSGGARNRSGPPVDPNSGRSDRRGVSFTTLPAEGFQGEIPEFPLPTPTPRELALWGRVWRTPQACAWILEPWRHYTVGQWVRWSVKAEAKDASASTIGAVIRFADQIGLSPAGLKENGWQVARNELERTAEQQPVRSSARDRMAVVRDGTEG